MQRCSLFFLDAVLMGDCLCFSHHDATLMLGVVCCAPGRDVLWSSDLYVGCCFVYFCLSFPDQDATLWWWGAVVLSFSQYDANILPCWWEAAFHPHIMMQLWCWGCSAVPQGQMCFDVVVYMWVVVLCIFFFPTSRCNSDVGSVLLCPWPRCFLIKWSVCVLLFSVSFSFHIKMKLWE